MSTKLYITALAILAAIAFGSSVDSFAQTTSTDDTSIVIPCTVQGYYRTDIVSRLDGFVGKISFEIGDEVKKGDVLIALHAPEVMAGVRQKKKLVQKAIADVQAVAAELDRVQARTSALGARTNLRESELNRIRSLVTSGVVTKAKQDEATFAYEAVLYEVESMSAEMKSIEAKQMAAEAAVEVARANLDYANVMAEYLSIVAPFDGVVTARNVDPGAYVRPPSGDAMPLLQIENIDKVRVVIMVPYDAAGGVNVGNEVLISGIRGQKDLQIRGTITRMASGFQKGSRMMRAEVEVDNKPDEKGKRALRSGDYGSAQVQLN